MITQPREETTAQLPPSGGQSLPFTLPPSFKLLLFLLNAKTWWGLFSIVNCLVNKDQERRTLCEGVFVHSAVQWPLRYRVTSQIDLLLLLLLLFFFSSSYYSSSSSFPSFSSVFASFSCLSCSTSPPPPLPHLLFDDFNVLFLFFQIFIVFLWVPLLEQGSVSLSSWPTLLAM